MTKDTKRRIIVDVILVVLGFVFLGFGIRDAIVKYKSSIVPDNVRFARSYQNAGEDNPYKYVSIKEANKILDSGSGVIFIGDPNDPWCSVLVRPLSKVVLDHGVDTIYYLEKSGESDLDGLHVDGEITLPYVIVVRDGKILKELSFNDIFGINYDGIPIEYFDDEQHVESLEESLKYIEKI